MTKIQKLVKNRNKSVNLGDRKSQTYLKKI